MKLTPQFCGGVLALALVASASGQPQPGTVLWTFDVGRTIISSPAVATDGTVYVGSDIALCAITNNGSAASNKWTFPVGLSGSPAVGADGTVYFNYQGTLVAVSPGGSQNWAFISLPGPLSVPPAIGFDNTLYYLAGGKLFAVSPSGAKKWEYYFDVSPMGYQAPVIGADGTIYHGLQRTFYAFSPDGTNKWSGSYNGNGTESPAIGNDGTVYFSAGQLNAFTPDGRNLWSLGGPLFDGPPVIGKSGAIYVAAFGSHSLYAVTGGGQVAWQALSGSDPRSPSTAAAVDNSGAIYYCVSNSVWALNPQGQVQWSIYAAPPGLVPEAAITSPVIGPDGTIYAALGTTLYAIAGTNPPPSSGWPMYRQNARHTGKVEKPALMNPHRRSDANFQFQLYAQLGQTNTVESTTNLSVWTSLTRVVVTNVPMDVVDLTASNAPARLYRSVAP